LVVAPRRIDGNRSPSDHFHPIFGDERQVRHSASPHHGGELRPFILEREVQMTRSVLFEVRNLSLDPDPWKACFERLLNLTGYVRYGENCLFACHEMVL
jgi:hypothetical protein